MIYETRLRTDAYGILYYDLCNNIEPDIFEKGGCLPYLKEDLLHHKISINDIKNYPWVINVIGEGCSPKDIEPFRQLLISYGVKQIGALFSACINVEELSYPAVSLPEQMVDTGNWHDHFKEQNTDWYNIPMTHQVVCLAGRPSVVRCTIARKLLEVLEQEQIIISLGINGDDLSPAMEKALGSCPYPMVIDIDKIEQENELTSSKLFNAPLQLIHETSWDGVIYDDRHVWNTQFITEKTYKALSFRQLPVWCTVSGFVNRVRELGFDVFDDIIDHSYDNVKDPEKRINVIMKEIKRLLTLDTRQIRLNILDRLQKNADIVDEIVLHGCYRNGIKIQKVIDKFKDKRTVG